MKRLVGAYNQGKALVGAFSVIVMVTLNGPGAGGAPAACLPALEQAEHHGGGGAGGRRVLGRLDHSLALHTRQVLLFRCPLKVQRKDEGRNQQILISNAFDSKCDSRW